MQRTDFVFAPRRSHYAGKTRCNKSATHWILAPDGKDVPGCYVCEDHGMACVTEYLTKLKEQWSLRELRIGR